MTKEKQTKKRIRNLESNRTYKLGDITVVVGDNTSFQPIKACQPLRELLQAEWPSGDDSTLVKACLELIKELLLNFIGSHFNSRDLRQSEFVYLQLRRHLVKLRKNSHVELPPIPSDILGVEDWITSIERALVKATTEPENAGEKPEQKNKGVDALTDEIETALGNAADPEGVEGVIEVLKFYIDELLTYKDYSELFAGLMGSIRYTLVYYKSKYPFMPTLPVDVAGVKEWITDFERASVKATKEPKNAGDTNKPKKKLKPLSERAAAVLELLKTLPEHRGMTGPKILETLDAKSINIDQSTLTKNIIPELKSYGVKNRPRIGYYIAQ